VNTRSTAVVCEFHTAVDLIEAADRSEPNP
jgi:hypothetical protein